MWRSYKVMLLWCKNERELHSNRLQRKLNTTEAIVNQTGKQDRGKIGWDWVGLRLIKLIEKKKWRLNFSSYATAVDSLIFLVSHTNLRNCKTYFRNVVMIDVYTTSYNLITLISSNFEKLILNHDVFVRWSAAMFPTIASSEIATYQS